VLEAFDWQHGVFLGATMASEKTAAAAGAVGALRYDPFAMLPFCGYNMGDYFAHWLHMGRARNAAALPRIFHVNWFRRGGDGAFLWPGFGENSRVLAWIFERCAGRGEARETPIGRLPAPGQLPVEGLGLPGGHLDELLGFRREDWIAELPRIAAHFERFGARLPDELRGQLQALAERLER